LSEGRAARKWLDSEKEPRFNLLMHHQALEPLSKEDLIALVLAQAAQIESLLNRVAELEAKLGQPPKTPDNSSVPPSQGAKPNRSPKPAKPRRGRPGTTRSLCETPDRIVEAVAEPWPHCQAELTVHDQADVHAYEQIELPALKPDITRVHRHAGVCPCCQRRFQAPVPAGLEPGSPFGPKLCALVVHLHVTQAIGLSLRRSASSV
jgi:transposase